jgi:SAM-dependent methyltransferase
MSDQCPNPACSAPDVATLIQCHKDYQIDDVQGIASFRFACCRLCGLAFVDPQPDLRVLDAFYPSDYAYWATPPVQITLAERIKYSLASWRHLRFLSPGPWTLLKSRIARIAEIAARRDASFSLGIPLSLPRESRILDYGFGAGAFLLALRALGFTALWGYDIESNRHNRDRLRSVGIQAFTGDEFAQLPDSSLDCIRLEHVLEHLPAPIDTLSALRKKLRPGGLLVVTVPSIHAWEPVEKLANSPYLDHLQLPIHLWHHSMRSLRDFLSAAGLDVVAVRRLRPFSYLTALARKPTR